MVRNGFLALGLSLSLMTVGLSQDDVAVPSADNAKLETVQAGDLAPSWVLPYGPAQFEWLRNWCAEKDQRLHLASMQPERHVVVMSFFATWCQPCMKELPHLETLYQKYKDQKIKFFLIDITEATRSTPGYENAPEAGPFLAEKGITIQVLNDSRGVVKEKYGVAKLPRLFVIDKYQKVTLTKQGFHENEDFEGELSALFDKLLVKEK